MKPNTLLWWIHRKNARYLIKIFGLFNILLLFAAWRFLYRVEGNVSNYNVNKVERAVANAEASKETTDNSQKFREDSGQINRSPLEQKLQIRKKKLEELRQYNKENIKNEKHRLPKVIGLGIKKCGSTGVITFLSHHPLVRIPPGHETFFFADKFHQGLDAYKGMLPPTNERQLAMEKTPIYFGFPPENMPQLIKSSIPDVKLLVIVCDPTARAFSDFIHERVKYKIANEKMVAKYETFEQYVDAFLPTLQDKIKSWMTSSTHISDLRKNFVDLPRGNAAMTLLTNGIYSAHIKSWQSLFNESSLKIIDGDRFIEDPGTVIEELQDFLGLPKVLLKEDFVRRPSDGHFCYRHFAVEDLQISNKEVDVKELKCLGKHKGRTRKGNYTASAETMERLRAFFRPFNQQFYEDVGMNFNWK